MGWPPSEAWNSTAREIEVAAKARADFERRAAGIPDPEQEKIASAARENAALDRIKESANARFGT